MSAIPVPVWIGTAGYAWPEWVGPFYPDGSTPERMPAYYATQFPCVEINSTFNRSPTAEQLDRLAIKGLCSGVAGFERTGKDEAFIGNAKRRDAGRRVVPNQFAFGIGFFPRIRFFLVGVPFHFR